MQYFKIIILSLGFVPKLLSAQTDMVSDTTVYSTVNKLPQFPTGEKGLFQYLSQNIRLPNDEKENGLESKFYIEFIVEKDGSITHIREIRGRLNAVDLAFIQKMPRWIPGLQDGKPVRVRYKLPINIHFD
jgi:protein TonB